MDKDYGYSEYMDEQRERAEAHADELNEAYADAMEEMMLDALIAQGRQRYDT